MKPKDASASASKPAKRWADLGKEVQGETVVVNKLGNVGDGQFFEDSFKNWISKGHSEEVKLKGLFLVNEL